MSGICEHLGPDGETCLALIKFPLRLARLKRDHPNPTLDVQEKIDRLEKILANGPSKMMPGRECFAANNVILQQNCNAHQDNLPR